MHRNLLEPRIMRLAKALAAAAAATILLAGAPDAAGADRRANFVSAEPSLNEPTPAARPGAAKARPRALHGLGPARSASVQTSATPAVAVARPWRAPDERAPAP